MISISDKTKTYLDMMENKFNIENFYEFVKDLLNLENEDIINGKFENATSEQYKHYIDKSQLYAKYQDNKREMIGVLIVKLKENKTPANARTLQRNYIAHLLEYYNLDASIAAIYSDTEDTWRLSFVKKELQIEVGKRGTKIGEKISPAKRYSYLFGKDEPNHTAKEQLLELLENNSEKFSIEKIEERFSVEKVTKDFFERYKENYLKLKEMLEKNEEFVSEAKRCDFTSEEFTKKLLGQIVFIYFLQKKGWLGVKLVPSILNMNEYKEIYDKQDILGKKILDKYYINYNGIKKIKSQLLEKYKENEDEINKLSSAFIKTKYDKMWGSGEKKFIRTIFTNCVDRNKNFFDDYLEPFFYDGLNNKRLNQYFGLFNCKIPFLNGGLFEPLDNYDWKIAKFNINNEVFSNKDETGILDFFDRYNFTMNEEEPLEKDVAVDPEMLGQIFEKLLDVKDRKSKGAFYTPREIVHYMCQKSLTNYLVNKVGVDYDEIKEFIQYGEMIRDIDLKEAKVDDYLLGKTIFKNIQNIDIALKNIKIADPAVGSGAFPLGMLNEIVKLRDIITSYMIIYNRLGLFDKKYSEEMITKKREIYNIKWYTIRNSIYAVDIENSAVDITKLRLWLSLVVDQVDVPISGPEPLPNLDCKIMQGNSLIDEYEGIKLIDDKFIDELINQDNISFNDGGVYKDGRKKVKVSQNQIQIGDGQKKSIIDELIKEKIEFFGTNDSKRKEEIKLKIKEIRKELLKLNFIGTNKIDELIKLDESHNKPYFAWKLEFIEVFIENNGFDIVIGNPPYGIVYDEKIKKIYEKNIETFRRNNDLYVAFYQYALNILNKKGILSYITPNTFLNGDYFKKIRKLLKSKTKIIEIVDFKNNSIFEDPTVYVAIGIYSKEKFINPYTFILKVAQNSIFDLVENNIEVSIVSDDPIKPMNKIFYKILKLDTFKLGDEYEVKDVGFNYWSKGKGKKRNENSIGHRVLYSGTKINENDIPFLKGRDIEKYYKDIPSNFLKYNYKEFLEPGIDTFRFSKEVMERTDKIIYRQTANQIIATIDSDKNYNDKTIHCIIPKKDTDISIKYILGLLNSKLFEFLYREISQEEKGRTFAQVKTIYIKQLPIKKPTKEQEEKIIKLVDMMLNERKFNRNQDISKYEEELNKEIFELYELTDEDIKMIRED